MRTELVSIPTDTAPLEGALHRPEADKAGEVGKARGGVLLMHGNTMNFYTGMPRFLPPYLTARGYVCLAYNRRGHDILGIHGSGSPEGGAFQTFTEAAADNAYAAGFLADRGFSEPIVMGHSLGGLLAGQYAAAYQATRALVLFSAIGGGPDGQQRDIDRGYLAGEATAEAVARAEQLMADGRGRELLLFPGWWYVVSAESYLDRFRSRPSLLELAPRITCPTLFIRGGRERWAQATGDRFQALAGGPCDVVSVEGSGHFYVGHEQAVSETAVDWLCRHLG